MTGPDSIARDELHAYVDGRLGPEAQARIEARLAQHPDDAAAVHAYRLQNSALRAAFAPVIEEPLPPELQAAVMTGAAARATARSCSWRSAESVVERSLQAWLRCSDERRTAPDSRRAER